MNRDTVECFLGSSLYITVYLLVSFLGAMALDASLCMVILFPVFIYILLERSDSFSVEAQC